MNYQTTCPTCASVFRLKPDQLDAAAGWAQCGVCGAQFDTRLTLLLEDGSPIPPPPEPIVEPTPELPPPAPAPSAFDAPALADEPAAVVPEPELAEPAADSPPDQPLPDETPATPLVGIARREHADELPSIILIDPYADPDTEPGPLPVISTTSTAPYPHTPLIEVTPAAHIEYATPLPGSARIPASSRRRVKPWVWGTAGALLTGLLLAQLSWFLRDTLVSRFPALRPGFEQACSVLGCALALPHDASQVRILGSDLQAEPGNAKQLRLTLTLANQAAHAQAWPVLVLTLTDNRDQPQARRSFAPSEYLSDAKRIAAGMAAATEYPLTLTLATRELKLAGYRLELTY
ncbi:MAG: DUF3426 domain-containing protein [Thiobacillus sp.]